MPEMPMDISGGGVAFVSHFEGFRATLYNDPAGNATIGYGHLVHTGPVDGTEPQALRDGISQKEAMLLLRQDLQHAVGVVRAKVTVPLNQHQFDTLVSFVFNVGEGNFARSDLLARLNKGEYHAVPYELSRWTRAGNVRYKGLIKRREQEGQLWRTGDYDPLREAVPTPSEGTQEAPNPPTLPPIRTDPPPGASIGTKVPWISQLDKYPTSDAYEFDCLAACAAMVLNHRGFAITPDEVTMGLGIPPSWAGGFHILDLTAQHNLVPPGWKAIWVHRGNLSWGQIAVETNANRPVIAYIYAANLPRNWRYKGFGGKHFVLITAIKGNNVHYLDPNWETESQGRCWLPQVQFAPAWAATNFQGLLVRDR